MTRIPMWVLLFVLILSSFTVGAYVGTVMMDRKIERMVKHPPADVGLNSRLIVESKKVLNQNLELSGTNVKLNENRKSLVVHYNKLLKMHQELIVKYRELAVSCALEKEAKCQTQLKSLDTKENLLQILSTPVH